MSFKNTEAKFGVFSKLLHWSIALIFIVQYFLVYRREYFPKGSEEKLQYILLHKSFGVTILILALIFLAWRHISKRPPMPITMKSWEKLLAKLTHVMLFLAMLAMPVTGYLMSAAAGRDVAVFGWFKLPLLLQQSKETAAFYHDVHEYISYVVIALFTLHVIGALYHHFIKRDNVLKRMLPFGG